MPDLTDLAGLARIAAARPGWMLRAACRSAPGVAFFPERGQPSAHALAVCSSCVVLDDCTLWALSDPDPTEGCGVAGGMTAPTRRAVRAARRNTAGGS